MYAVALLAEGVDRNDDGIKTLCVVDASPSSRRAWIEIVFVGFVDGVVVSPSSRRAWIEIRRQHERAFRSPVALLAEGVDRNPACPCSLRGRWVALLAEGVDRNASGASMIAPAVASPSSRRAWIEMQALRRRTCPHQVALLAEGVDRNAIPPSRAGS